MEHAYEKDLYELLDLVNEEMDKNPNHKSTNPKNGKVAKQNCVWNQSSKDDKKIYFVPKMY
jgi:hypothetical protein